MNKNEQIKLYDNEINETEQKITWLEKQQEKLYNDLTTVERLMATAKKNLENLKLAKECMAAYEEMPELRKKEPEQPKVEKKTEEVKPEEEKKEEVKVPKKEITYTSKRAKIGRFDSYGNQTGIWYTRAACAHDIGLTPGGVGYILKSPKENQIKKRGCYFAYVY